MHIETGLLRVLIANEPRAYREVLGHAIAGLRPQVAVTVAEPDQLDALLVLMSPHVVVTSRTPVAATAGVRRVVVLYPDGTNDATFEVDGVRTTVADVELDGLLALIDATRATDAVAPSTGTPDRPAA